jgi:hypothetical protein
MTEYRKLNAHYVIIDFRAKFFIKIQNQASDTSLSLPSFSSAPYLLRAVPTCYARSLASDLGKSRDRLVGKSILVHSNYNNKV